MKCLSIVDEDMRSNPEFWAICETYWDWMLSRRWWLLDIAFNPKPHCYVIEARSGHASSEVSQITTFTNEDRQDPYADHTRPLYLSATINDV